MNMKTNAGRLVEALAELSPLARQKIKATLEDQSMEITWNQWSGTLQPDNRHEEPRACGCLMLDGYFKEHPPEFMMVEAIWPGGKPHWVMRDAEPQWPTLLATFYEMDDHYAPEDAIETVAATYDDVVKYDANPTKFVRGVEVLRVPLRRRLVKLVEKAEALAVQGA